MIYGINFTGKDIPDKHKRKFAARVRVAPGLLADLKGVCESNQEANTMLIIASNGHRKLHVEQRGTLFGIYVYY